MFAAAIAVNLARGRRPDCHCFGDLHARPAGPATLGQNLVLAAGAGAVALAGRGGEFEEAESDALQIEGRSDVV